MKTRALVLIGVLIIALAAMAMPVMAGSGSGSSEAQGGQEANVSFNVLNSSISFGTAGVFAIGDNVILPTGSAAFPVVSMYTNENTWAVTVKGSSVKMNTTSGLVLTNDLKINSNAIQAADGSSSTTRGFQTESSVTTLGDAFLTGAGPVNMENTTVSLKQTVIPKDKASPSGDPYRLKLTFDYSGSA